MLCLSTAFRTSRCLTRLPCYMFPKLNHRHFQQRGYRKHSMVSTVWPSHPYTTARVVNILVILILRSHVYIS